MQRQSPDRPARRLTGLRPAATPALDLATRANGAGHHVLDVSGAVHAETVGALRAELASLASSPDRARLVVDLRGVTFLDGHGLGALVGGMRQLRRAGGCLHPIGNPLVDELLVTSGLDRVLAADGSCAV